MRPVDRREFLSRAGGIAGALLVPPSLQGLVACNRADVRRAGLGDGGYGPLSPHAGCPELALPEGFHCVKLSTAGDPMEGGLVVPNAFDGMTAFAGPNGAIRLIRNHEIRDAAGRFPVIGDPAKAYDPLGPGGTTTMDVRVNADGSREKVREFLSLSGTIVNCAGGPTPWGSWLTCEELTEGTLNGWRREHGYVFEVPVSAQAQVPAVPLQALGRFVHEAVAVDPSTGIVYLTEDREFQDGNAAMPGAGFYRFVPEWTARPPGLLAAGKLQMLAVKDHPNYSTVRGQRPGVALPATWVDIDDPDPPGAGSDPWAVFAQGAAKGAAVFQRLEGCWFGDGSVFFVSTSGGDARSGQVWQYRSAGTAGGALVMVFESPSPDVLDRPDNLVMSPRPQGGLVLCEDGGGDQYVRGLTRRGEIFDFAKNLADTTEFAGACFSPDGQTFFVNIFGNSRRQPDGTYARKGMTFAIWGPWERGAL